MSPRPRAFVVGEEALVRRRRGWGCAAALVVAEHAASFLGLCLCSGCVPCGAGGSPSRFELALGRAMRRPNPASGAGARVSGALPVRRAPAQAGQAPCGRGGAGAPDTSTRGFRRLLRSTPGWFREATYVRVPTSIGQRSSGRAKLSPRRPKERPSRPSGAPLP